MSAKYERLKRHEIKCIVEEQYGITVLSMHEMDRSIMLYTDQGLKRLKRLNKDYARIIFVASAYDHIKKNGFEQLSYIHTTQSGAYTIKYGKNTYVLQDYAKGKIFEVTTKEAAMQLGEVLARYHKACENFIPASGCSARVDWGRWMDKFKGYGRNIARYKDNILSQGSLSRFDKAYIKYADDYYNKMDRAYRLLSEHGYLNKVRQSMKCNQLTHKAFKKHAVLATEAHEIYVTEMENCGYDICEIDLATLLERFAGRSRVEDITNVELAKAVLDGYCGVQPLNQDSIKIIQAFMIEPKRFYKIIDRYYGKKKNDTEMELLQKLERTVQKEARKDELIDLLENYSYERNLEG